MDVLSHRPASPGGFALCDAAKLPIHAANRKFFARFGANCSRNAHKAGMPA
jgi:hypothetical protein